MTWPIVALIALVWLLLLATAWLAFVGWFRVRTLRQREELRVKRLEALGAFAPDEAGEGGQTDAEAAWLEAVAKRRSARLKGG